MLLSYSLFIIYGKPMQRKKKKDQVHINYVHWNVWYAAYHVSRYYLNFGYTLGSSGLVIAKILMFDLLNSFKS